MCLIAWNWQPDSDTPLLLIGNRDEFYARPTLPLHWWEGGSLLAGKDLQGGGTWLGISRDGRLAALTNYRDPGNHRPDAPSRGELVAGFLQGNLSASAYLDQLSATAADYNPFNLLLLDGRQLLGFESGSARRFAVPPGIGAVSNANFDSPWPKLVRLKQDLSALVAAEASDVEALLRLLRNDRIAADAELPATGIPLERERALSAAFIATPDYGTRACSVVRIRRTGTEFLEQSFDAVGPSGISRFTGLSQVGHPPACQACESASATNSLPFHPAQQES